MLVADSIVRAEQITRHRAILTSPITHGEAAGG